MSLMTFNKQLMKLNKNNTEQNSKTNLHKYKKWYKFNLLSIKMGSFMHTHLIVGNLQR